MLYGFLAMLIDKQKAKRGSWRIPEKSLFTITLLGGGVRNYSTVCMFLDIKPESYILQSDFLLY